MQRWPSDDARRTRCAHGGKTCEFRSDPCVTRHRSRCVRRDEGSTTQRSGALERQTLTTVPGHTYRAGESPHGSPMLGVGGRHGELTGV